MHNNKCIEGTYKNPKIGFTIDFGAIFYLSLFVKYTHPTTVAPNIDIVATKGSCAIAKHNPIPPTVTPLAIMVFLFIYFTFFSNLSHTVLY